MRKPKSRVNAKRLDPYKNFKFRVTLAGRAVAGFSEVSALATSADPVEHREGGVMSALRKLPGLRKYPEVTLKRGIILNKSFAAWATKGASDAIPRKNLTIELYNERGKRASGYKLRGCWVSEVSAIHGLDANAAVVIQHLKLETAGWQADEGRSKPPKLMKSRRR